jgi:hypothetical protein
MIDDADEFIDILLGETAQSAVSEELRKKIVDRIAETIAGFQPMKAPPGLSKRLKDIYG